jgi:hypothetical protein
MEYYVLFADPRVKEGEEIINLFNNSNLPGVVVSTGEGDASPELAKGTPGSNINISGYKNIIDFLKACQMNITT